MSHCHDLAGTGLNVACAQMQMGINERPGRCVVCLGLEHPDDGLTLEIGSR